MANDGAARWATGTRTPPPDIDLLTASDAAPHVVSDDTDTTALERTPRRFTFFPALDGLRGAFAIAVLSFHAGGGFPGALLAMTGFFVLSGFLITSILLGEWLSTGRIRIGAFLLNRARRLLPAAFVTIAFVAVFWTLLDLRSPGALAPDVLEDALRRELLGAALYFHNWLGAFGPGWENFAALTVPGAPEASPLSHFWSLAVEEQFYLVYPVVLAALFTLFRSRIALAVMAGAGIVASALLAPAAVGLTVGQAVPVLDRIYRGTDVRVAEILVGVLLGVVFSYPAARRWITSSPVVVIVSTLAAAVMAVAWFTVRITDLWLYQHGFLAVAAVFAVIIAGCTAGAGPLVAVLGWAPLRWIGERSYGLYLYHFPIQHWLDATTTGLPAVPLFVLQMTVTVVLAMVSYTFLELPVRRRERPRQPWWWAAGGLAFCAVALGLPLVV